MMYIVGYIGYIIPIISYSGQELYKFGFMNGFIIELC